MTGRGTKWPKSLKMAKNRQNRAFYAKKSTGFSNGLDEVSYWQYATILLVTTSIGLVRETLLSFTSDSDTWLFIFAVSAINYLFGFYLQLERDTLVSLIQPCFHTFPLLKQI